MAIQQTDLRFALSLTVTDTGINGGRCGQTLLPDSGVNNVFQNVQDSERSAGSEKYRKVYFRNINANGDVGYNARVYVDKYTSEDDRVVMFSGPDTQADITGAERKYGSGQLASDVLAGVVTIDVTVEDAADGLFADGDTIRISDKASASAVTGNYQFLTVSGTPAVNGNTVTIPLSGALLNNYLAANTRVQSCIPVGDLEPSAFNYNPGTAQGTYDSANYPLELDNEGTIDQVWTITFTSATAFDVAGDTKGAVGSGNTLSDSTLLNSATGTPYFVIPSAAWGGTWQAGDTLTVETGVSGKPFWLARIVDAGMPAPANDSLYSFGGVVETSNA